MPTLTLKPSTNPVKSVTICGSGLALWMCAAALSLCLARNLQITIVEMEETPLSDMLYGPHLPPQTFDFHTKLGLSEADLILKTQATFSYGTTFSNWPAKGRSWVQAFHQPFAVWRGIPLPKLVAHTSDLSLQDLMISAQAAKEGVFAHPPADPGHPLSRAEYGYLIDPIELANFYKSKALSRSIDHHLSGLKGVERHHKHILALHLENGATVKSDFYIDTSATGGLRHGVSSAGGRQLAAKISRIKAEPESRSTYQVQGSDIGWQARADFTDGYCVTSLSDRDDEALASLHPIADAGTLTFDTGQIKDPWVGNILAIGQAARKLEPFTTAPMICLQRDVERLLDLFPVTIDMPVEAREYNRQADETFRLAEVFNQAHFPESDHPDHSYWQSADEFFHPELQRKLTQYFSRGHLVSFDSDPFDDVAWAVLHEGMGRVPERTDPLVAIADMDAFLSDIGGLKHAIDQLVPKIPAQLVYRGKFQSYLERTVT